jgi:hypothetical protein
MSDRFAPDRRVVHGAVDIPDADVLHGRERACDADRDRYIAHLSECFRLGYIPEAAFRARMAAAAEAVARDDLARLLGDLPAFPSPHRHLRAIWAALDKGTRRRWMHITAATTALLWAIMAPLVLYTATGYPVIYGSGNWAWEATQHSALALAAMWFFIITGVAGFCANLYWWAKWEM